MNICMKDEKYNTLKITILIYENIKLPVSQVEDFHFPYHIEQTHKCSWNMIVEVKVMTRIIIHIFEIFNH